MIDLASAALIAKMTSDAVGALDKIYRSFADYLREKKPSVRSIPQLEPDYAYVDAPEKGAFEAKSRRTGYVCRTVTYGELRSKLEGSDLEYVETLSRTMQNYEHRWNSVRTAING
jgi:hypothetical protein